MESKLNDILNKFTSVTLEELDKVALLNRIDTKYVFNIETVPDLLNELTEHFKILEIDSKRTFTYSTLYYDTPEAEMYVNHVRGKLNRYKVRHRLYKDSGLSYLEVKFKTNKSRTIKWRTREAFENEKDKTLNISFLKKHIPYDPEKLKPVLENEFRRITLVDNNFTQRFTLDIQLGFNGEGEKNSKLHQLAIAEVKTDKSNKNSILLNTLKKYRIKPSGFSKYCIGRTLTYKDCVKPGGFKSKLLQLNKIANEIIYS